MSSIQSSTSVISSPFATVKEQVKPARFDASEREPGSVGAAFIGVGDAIAEGASATVSLSEKALHSVEDAGSYIGHAVATGISDVGAAAMAAYGAVRGGIGNSIDSVEHAAEATWDTIKAGALDVAGMAGDVVHAAESGAEAVADVATDAWHGVEHLASEALHGIERGTDELEHLGSEAWHAVQDGTHRAREAAGTVGDGIRTAAGYVGDGLGEVADGVGNVAGRMASYATVGAAAIERAFTAIV